jgi:type II secretory pathway pseudopilin PulG
MSYLLITNTPPAMRISQNPLNNQNGSVILVAIMLLALMTIIAISASSTAITESFIIRNVAIHKQNVSLVEAAALQLAQDALLNIREPANENLAESSPVREPYIITDTEWETSGKKDDWYDFGTTNIGRVLDDPDDDPTTFPQYIEPELTTDMTLIEDVRGDTGAPLRIALVGWESAPGSSLRSTMPTRKRARVMAEYMSEDFGMTRLELGIEREY